MLSYLQLYHYTLLKARRGGRVEVLLRQQPFVSHFPSPLGTCLAREVERGGEGGQEEQEEQTESQERMLSILTNPSNPMYRERGFG